MRMAPMGKLNRVMIRKLRRDRAVGKGEIVRLVSSLELKSKPERFSNSFQGLALDYANRANHLVVLNRL